MKNKRQEKLLELVRLNEIITQEQLAAMLDQAGFTATQATVSRDIKDLHLVKIPASDMSKYKYALNQQFDTGGQMGQASKYLTLMHDSIVRVGVANNLCVIKTSTGMAQGVAVAIDALESDLVAHYNEMKTAEEDEFSSVPSAIPESADQPDYAFVVGTLAGDDTIFIATHSQHDAEWCAKIVADMIK